MALNLLNIGSSTDVKNAIAEGNIRYLQAAQGVGKRSPRESSSISKTKSD